jgi:hypothetical protein
MMTTYERGYLQGHRDVVFWTLEARFGSVTPAVKQRVEALSLEELRRLGVDLLKAQSLAELGLKD